LLIGFRLAVTVEKWLNHIFNLFRLHAEIHGCCHSLWRINLCSRLWKG